METPPVPKKTLVASVSRSTLTPCRRLGLCRPSPSGLNKSCRSLSVVSTPAQQDTPKLNCDLENRHSMACKVRKCLTVASRTQAVTLEAETGNCVASAAVNDDSQACKRSKLSVERTISANVVKECTNLDSSARLVLKPNNSVTSNATESMDEVDDLSEEVTLEVIEELVKSIQEKKKKLEQLKVQETYAKKHNLEELRAQTAKWKLAGREALEYSVSLAKHAGYSVTTSQLMSQHCFPRHLMGYNSEDDEFQ